MYTGSEAQIEGQKLFKARMAEFIKDKRLLEGVSTKDPYQVLQSDS